jgi:hypothetical protein
MKPLLGLILAEALLATSEAGREWGPARPETEDATDRSAKSLLFQGRVLTERHRYAMASVAGALAAVRCTWFSSHDGRVDPLTNLN